MKATSKYPVKSLVKSLLILEHLGTVENGSTLGKISTTLCIGKSTVHRLLATLKDHDFVWLDPQSSRYMLGARILQLSQNVAMSWGEPILARLAEATGETCNLAVLEGTEVRYVVIKESKNPLRMSGQSGRKLPAHCTALGKALLSDLSRKEILHLYGKKQRLETPTPNSISMVSELCDYLERTRPAGVFVDSEEMFSGVICLAAPIRNRHGKIIAAVSISFPKQRVDSSQIGDFRSLLLDYAKELSHQLRHHAATAVREKA